MATRKSASKSSKSVEPSLYALYLKWRGPLMNQPKESLWHDPSGNIMLRQFPSDFDEIIRKLPQRETYLHIKIVEIKYLLR